MSSVYQVDGIYSFAYTGKIASGIALLLLKDGLLVGADVAGGRYDGVYEELENTLNCNIKMFVPAGVRLATDTLPREHPYTVDFPISIDLPISDEQIILFDLPIGKVNVIIRKIRGI